MIVGRIGRKRKCLSLPTTHVIAGWQYTYVSQVFRDITGYDEREVRKYQSLPATYVIGDWQIAHVSYT